jgi:hypothetical protein
MKTVITHFYNEEHLLPWWLEYHKKIFDFGVLINYQSTDRSVELCKEICPHWQVVSSMHTYFDAENCDNEVTFYENQLSGWRIALTTTEFLVGNVNKLCNNNPAHQQHIIPGIRFTKWDPLGSLDRNKQLWEQVTTGISYYDNYIAHQGRSLHNYTGLKYPTGRHFGPYTTEEALIFHYAHAIVGKEMIQRRLQFQYKISDRDKERGIGNHHYVNKNGLTFNGLYEMHTHFISQGQTDCSVFIEKMFGKQ